MIRFIRFQSYCRSGAQSYSGLLSGYGADGSITLITADGKGILIPGAAIVSRQSSTVSLMPEGLENAMTVQAFRDLARVHELA